MQERPQVTITNPAVAVLALLAGLSGADELRERRAADAEERRPQAVLQLKLTDRFGSLQTTDYDSGRQEAVLSRALGIRNTGPRPVVVESVAVGGLRLAGGDVAVAPGREERLLVQQRLPCLPQPGSASNSLSVLLGVRTGAGLQEQELLLGDEVTASGEDARRACGIVPAGEALQLFFVIGGRVQDGALDVPMRAVNYGARDVRLLDVRAGSGLTAEILDGAGPPVPLPLELAGRAPDGSVLERALLLRLRVVDCALVDASDTESYQPDSAFSVSYVAADDVEPKGAGAATTVLYDANAVRDLVAEACP